jgi:photosystem II stability/assembly factor-like uncharacterized protein
MRPALLALALLFSLPLCGQTWQSLGPPGGDVRTMGHDPRQPGRLYLGTADGHVFGSGDAGAHWRLLGRVGSRLDGVVAAILVDPRNSQTLYAAMWTQDPSAGGGVFRSDDGGTTWRESGLIGQAVRALAQAPSDPDVLVAGTLGGVFRSNDAGDTWRRISPDADVELRNLDSVAVDPRRSDTIYVGTFHLPWRSSDGGRSWTPIPAGMIDDSDVMSILVDRSDPQRVYASACSGIYRSENGADLWQKVQGIPFSARRTNVIAQDSLHPGSIFAGTTEGLWKSDNAGSAWRRMTPADWVINAVDLPAGHPGRVVLGTEELGVMVSDDGGEHFRSSNDGFNHRQIAEVAVDPNRPGRILAVLSHASEPVLATDDGGQSWAPLGSGLAAHQIKRIFASPDGWWVALEAGGLMRYDARDGAWVRAGTPVGAADRPLEAATPARREPRSPGAASATPALDFVVNDIAFAAMRWFAATESGLFVSEDRGVHWQPLPLGPAANLPVASVRASADGRSLWVVSLRGLVFSSDGGIHWTWHDLPLAAGGALRLDLAPAPVEGQTLVAAALNGLFISRDAAGTWQQAAAGLPEVPIEGFAMVGRVFVASLRLGGLFLSLDEGRTWNRVAGTLAEGFFPVVAASGEGNRILAASASDGLYAVEFLVPASASGQ